MLLQDVGVNMRLLISALTGVIVACLIFSVIFFAPRYFSPKILLGISVGGDQLLEMVGPQGSVYCESFPRYSPCILNVTLYEFTAPLGLGGEADLAIEVTSRLNSSQEFRVNARMDLGGTRFSDGGSEWTWAGNLEANETKIFNHRIKAEGVGFTALRVTVETQMLDSDSLRTYGWVMLDFVAMPDNVLVYLSSPRPKPGVSLQPIRDDWRGGGVGSEFNVSLSLFGDNAIDVTLKLVTPEGIVPTGGQTAWTGNVTIPGQGINVSARLKFVKTGSWFIYAYVEKDNVILCLPRAIEFIVSESSSTYIPIV